MYGPRHKGRVKQLHFADAGKPSRHRGPAAAQGRRLRKMPPVILLSSGARPPGRQATRPPLIESKQRSAQGRRRRRRPREQQRPETTPSLLLGRAALARSLPGKQSGVSPVSSLPPWCLAINAAARSLASRRKTTTAQQGSCLLTPTVEAPGAAAAALSMALSVARMCLLAIIR